MWVLEREDALRYEASTRETKLFKSMVLHEGRKSGVHYDWSWKQNVQQQQQKGIHLRKFAQCMLRVASLG